MRAGDTEVAEQQRGGFGFHRSSSIGVQAQLAGRDVVVGDGIVEQRFEQGGGLGIGEVPSDDAAAVDIENDVEIEVSPFGRPLQFGDIPGPDFIRPFCQQLGLGVGGVA